MLPVLRFIFLMTASLLMLSCTNEKNKGVGEGKDKKRGSYGYDAEFLKKHTAGVLELYDETGESKVLLSADYQGRVMTSTASGDTGLSYGWLNYDLISSGEMKPHINPVGGEERFWMGPEGGQYSIYFNKGDSFVFSKWQVPAVIDTVAFDIVQSDHTEAVFSKKTTLTNYSGTTFHLNIERAVRLLDKNALQSRLKTSLAPNLKFVAYETENRLQNTGPDWSAENGLLSIWLLGMFIPSPKTVVIIPFTSANDTGTHITDDYFGPVPAERLWMKDNVLFFVCDGKYRSKIGISPAVAKPIAASFDFEKNVLTVVIPEIHKGALYVNSKWELQKQPYKGDVINAYNDGPLEDGSQMGPFYEIESSSPALQLKSGQTGTYRQTTCHIQGTYEELRQLAKELLGVDLDTAKK